MGNKSGIQTFQDDTNEEEVVKSCKKIKIALIGPRMSGKSSVFKRYLTGTFQTAYSPDFTGFKKLLRCFRFHKGA